MSYTFARVTILYPDFVDRLYAANPAMREADYHDQYAFVMNEAFGEGDHMEVRLRERGVRAEVFAAGSPMQAAWAREHGLPADMDRDELVLEQLRRLQPQVLFVHNPFVFGAAFVERARRIAPSIRLVVGWSGIGFDDNHIKQFRSFDAMLTCNRAQLHDFQAAGLPCGLVNHGFEERLLPLVASGNEPETDLLFAGSLIISDGYHRKRVELLNKLLADGVDVVVHGLLLPDPERFPPEIRAAVRPPVYGLDMLRAIAGARVCLNAHLDANRDYAGNIRLFEATGVGSCLLTDNKRNITEFFRPGVECQVYDDAVDLVAVAHDLLENEEKRASIAKAGQQKTLREFTFAQRAANMDRFLRERL